MPGGAPKGNLNALKHGERSRNWRETRERKYKKHPGRGGARPGSHVSRRNLNALKHGRFSKEIERQIKINPAVKHLTKDQAREYLVGQLKHY